MSNDNEKSKFSNWLENLQQESWQLELLISGFTILLLFGAKEPLFEWFQRLNHLSSSHNILSSFPFFIIISWYMTIVNLLIHVLLRSVWIGAIGLRYVSGDIDYEMLHLPRRFSDYLHRKVVSFDDYIERLERLCSIAFSFTFLIVMATLSFYLVLFFFLLLNLWVIEPIQGWFGFERETIVGNVLIFILMGGAAIYCLDFITLGWVKRRRRLGKIYMPIYRFYSFLSFAFIYRPLYYNFIDNKLGRRVMLFCIPYIFLLGFIATIKLEGYAYLPRVVKDANIKEEHLFVNNHFYDDKRDNDEWIERASIPSKVTTVNYLELFILFSPYQDQFLDRFCPDFEPIGEQGIKTLFNTSQGKIYKRLKTDTTYFQQLMTCASQLYEVYIDDVQIQNPDFLFHRHINKGEKGMLTLLDISDLEKGKHILKINRIGLTSIRSERKGVIDEIFIPFWKYVN